MSDLKLPPLFRGTRVVVALILLLPLAVRLPFWIGGFSQNPIWTSSGLVLPGLSQLVPGLPGYVDPNAGESTLALGTAAAHLWASGDVPWWDSYSGLGLPMAAEMQSSALFLPYILLLLLPCGYVLLMLALQCTAGLATWRLLRRLELGPRAAVTGALLFELCASFSWLGPPPSLPVAFLPLFLLGLEHARAASVAGQHGGWRTIAVAVALSILAGFPETAYLDGLFALLWALCRLATLPGKRADYGRRVAFGGIIGLLLAAPLLWPFLDLLRHAGLGARAGINMSRIFLPREALGQLLVPYALGPITGLASETAIFLQMTLWGRVASYAGTTLALAALLGAVMPGPDRFLRWAMLVWVTVVVGRIIGTPFLHVVFNAVPFSSSIQVFRYSGAAWLLPCCVLAASAVDRAPGLRRVWPCASLVALAAASGLVLAWPLAQVLHNGCFWFIASAVWATGTLAAFALAAARKRPEIMAWLLVADATILFAVPLASGFRNGRLDTPAISFLKSHLGEQRFASLGPFSANYGAMLGAATINDVYLPVPDVWTRYVDRHLRPGGDQVRFNGEKAEDAVLLEQRLSNYAKIAVKYILAFHGSDPFGPPALANPRTPLMLKGGDSATGQMNLPADPTLSVSVVIGTYKGASTGDLEITLCALNGVCSQGHAKLVGAVDNHAIRIPLDQPLTATGPALWTLRHPAGTPVAIWLYDTQAGRHPDIQALSAPSPGTPARVYSDALMDIYEIPNAAPYVSAPGCMIQSHGRAAFDADCPMATTLIRRELALEGWQARVNGSLVPINVAGEILQSLRLPAGRSIVTLNYRPPYYGIFMLLFVIGAAALFPWSATGAALKRGCRYVAADA